MIFNQKTYPLFRHLVLFVFLVLSLSGLKSQPLTVIKGKVTDATTNEPIPFANVVFKGTVVGTSTDFNGMYTISTRSAKDSLSIVFMGYKPKSKFVIKGKSQTIDFQLEPTSVTLKEVVINSGENPAWRILRKVWNNKDSVNKSILNAYQYESYTRIEVAADNLENFSKVKMTKSLLSLFDSLRVAAGEDGKKVLPVFISETKSEMFYLKDPYRKKEYIKASKLTGIGLTDGTTTTQYIGSTYQDYNFNNDWLSILDKDFISPIARVGLIYYKYYLIDSMVLDGKFCYEIKVIPKRPQDLAFTGTIWITDTTYALKRIVVEVGKSANINFIERIKIQQDLERIGTSAWAPYRTRILVDAIQPTKNTFSFIGKFYMYNYNWVVNQPKDMKFYEDKIVRADDYLDKPKNYWDTARPEAIDSITKHIYDIVDSMKEIPKVKTYTKYGKILFTGYIATGKYLEVGPWQMVYGYNEVEGNRFRVGVRTNYAFSRYWMFKTYIAYGTKDNKFKYNFMVERFISRRYWARTGVQYKYDIEGMGAIDPFYEKNSISSSSQQLGLYSRMSENTYYRYWLSSDIISKKFNERLIVTYRYFKPVGHYVFAYYDRYGNIKSDFNNFEIALESRFAPKEILIINDNDRFSMGSTAAPIFTLKTIFGIQDVLESEFNYQKVSLNISQTLKLGVLGRTTYSLTATKIWGTVPYPLLNILPGNENIIASTSTYNLVNFFEFVSDESLELILNHYFGGLFFNRIPLFKKLKFREVIGAKAVWGSMRPDNLYIHPPTDASGQPVDYFTPLRSNQPYVEVFAGIDNIMRFFRIDFIYRLTYLNEPYHVQQWGLKWTAHFQL